MACAWFDRGRVPRCGAVAGLLIPSHYERERYCLSDESEQCPTLKLFRQRRAPLDQATYYALWLAPEPSAEEPVPLESPPLPL